jgi:N-acetyl-gamma-glutamyl-phosphate reductase
MTVKVGIAGVTGYTGGELIRLIMNHPKAKIVAASSRSNVGNPVSAVHKQLYGYMDLIECEMKAENFAECDVVFLALPHGASSGLAKELVSMGKKVIDLGADMRLRDYDTYMEWYGAEHHWPEILPDAVYGLPELYRERIKSQDLIANPGCYPTSIILGLAPLLKKGWVKLDSIVCDSKSGVTGAGKSLTQNTHFPDCNDNLSAYKIAAHRHTPEIEQELSALAGESLLVSFNPHLIPMNRGILSTITMQAAKTDLTQELLDAAYQEFYANEEFVRVRNKADLPTTKQVQGSNYCDIAPVWDPRTKRIIVVSVIDNLVKGAAGQAIQNMNLMMGLDEGMGLRYGVMYP